MLMIVAHHFAYRSGMEFDTSTITVNRLWTQLLMYGGHVGLDVFVLISGYFLVKRDRLDLSKIVRIWLMMFTYSVAIYYILVATGVEVDLLKEFAGAVFAPVCVEVWPFASAFFGLMLVYPFVNKLLNALSKNQYRVMLALMLFFWSVLPTFTGREFGSNYFLWLVTLYALAGYIKLFPEDFARGKSFYCKWMLIVWGLSFASAIVLDILGFKYEFCARYATHFSGMQHINIVFIAVCLFLTFKEIGVDSKYSSVINLIASATFGVYLIHDNPLLSQWIWKQLFRNVEITGNWWFIFESVGEVVAVFIVCMAIELLRQKLLEKWYMKGVNALLDKPQKFVDGWMKSGK